ncbi:methyltransferase domain-containing protein [Bacillus cereus]|nr:methyltransferase domain-containing protein [Bacillus cereus]
MTNLDIKDTTFISELEILKEKFTDLYSCIDLEKIPVSMQLIKEIESEFTDFESTDTGGRGEVYRIAQKNITVRSEGIKNIFSLLSPNEKIENLSSDMKLLDALGGDGLLTKVVSNIIDSKNLPQILTTDISADMINAAKKHNIPALRLAAQYLAIKDYSLDGVIFAYGTHHIPVLQRLEACKEAYRVLKKGGKFILHDFESCSPAANWFQEVVHKYSLTGHDFSHFDYNEIKSYLYKSGFESFKIEYMYDPFIFTGNSMADVKFQFTDYLHNMYGLYKLDSQFGEQEVHDVIYQLANKYFVYDYQQLGVSQSFGKKTVKINQIGQRWQLEMPRVAIVGSGIK